MWPVGSRCLRIKNTESYERVRITWLNHLSVLCFSADTLLCVIVHSSAGLNCDCVTPPTLVCYRLSAVSRSSRKTPGIRGWAWETTNSIDRYESDHYRWGSGRGVSQMAYYTRSQFSQSCWESRTRSFGICWSRIDARIDAGRLQSSIVYDFLSYVRIFIRFVSLKETWTNQENG